MRPAGVEPATYGFEVRRSIQLSYERLQVLYRPNSSTEVGFGLRVGDGDRTHDNQIHSLALYHLSYTHRAIGRRYNAEKLCCVSRGKLKK